MCMLTVDNDAWTGIGLGLRLVHGHSKVSFGCETLRCIALHCGSLWSSLQNSGFLDNVSWQLSCCLALFVVGVVVVNCAAIKGRRRHIKILKCFLPPPLLLPPTINGRGSVAATDRKCQRAFLFFFFSFFGPTSKLSEGHNDAPRSRMSLKNKRNHGGV